MLKRIIEFSVHNKLIVTMLVLAMVGVGIYNLTRLPIDAVPDITNNQVQVITVSPSLGAADIERLITFPVEQATRNVPHIIEQRSFSRFGLSLVTIVFDDEADIYWARQQISERLTQIQDQIPPGSGTPVLGPISTGLGEIFQYVVRPKPGYEGKYDAMELRTIQDWIVRRQLLGTPGVAEVSSFGGFLKQYEIAVSPDKLKSYRLTIADLFAALEANNQNTGGSYIEKGPTALFIRSEGLVKSPEEVGQIMVTQTDEGMPVLVRDVAEVRLGSAVRYGALTYNDQGEVAGAVVMMLKGENSPQVIKDVKKRIDEIGKTLPEGVMIEPFLDRTKMVNNAIRTVETNLLEGALIVVFILVLFLGNLRAGLVVASVIPLSMLFAVSMMNLFGVSGNLMSLGALDFGLIVDGAVIIVEAVMHRLMLLPAVAGAVGAAAGIRQQEINKEVTYSAGKMMNAAVFGQIIILIVYLPILSLEGIEGKMFGPMAQTVSFAIIGAFLLSLTYVPMMSALVLGRRKKGAAAHKPNFSDRLLGFLERHYKRLLLRAIAIPKTILLVSVGLFAVALLVLSRMGGEFIPELEEGDSAVECRLLTGSSLTETIKATQQASSILLERFPEVEKVVTKIGSAEVPSDPMPVESGDIIIVLKNKKEWTSAESFSELAEKMSTAMQEVPGLSVGLQFPVQMRFNELMTGARQDVVCKIFGDDLDTLAHYAGRLSHLAGQVDGAVDMYQETVTGLPQIVVNYDRAALARFNLNVADVNNTLQAAFAGAVAGQIFESDRRFDLVVRLASNYRQDIRNVQNLLIATPDGGQIPLQQVAKVQIQDGPNQIQREDAQRRITVGFNVRGRDVQSIVKELQQRVDKELKLPHGYYITYGGEFENQVAATSRLQIAVPVALLLIFVLLYFAFGSVSQGLLVYSAIPLSAIGGVLALWLRDMPFSISAGVGFIALFGVAVLNGIVLISEFNELKKSGVTDTLERVLKGTQTRLRPVLMTAAVASMGFLPMALSQGAGAEVQRPLATVVIGGLITATLLTLLVLPILYLLLENKQGPFAFRFFSRKKSTAAAAVLFFSGLCAPAFAQAPKGTFLGSGTQISLEDAKQLALKNNLHLQTSRLQTQQREQLEKTAWDLPQTQLSAEYGQLNSLYNDNRFGLAQGIAFPVVYKRQKEVLQAETESSRLTEAIRRQELKKHVAQVYMQMQLLLQKQQLLVQADSLYQAFAERQNQRFAAGDINLLQQTAAQTQRMQIGNQLSLLQLDLASAQEEFSRLLNTPERYIPIKDQELKLAVGTLPDTANLRQHPQLRLLQQQQTLAQRQWQLEKSRMLPQLELGYFNQSFQGFQQVNGAEQYYGRGYRFHSGMVGVSVPVFFRAGRARIQGARIGQEIARNEQAAATQQLSSRLRQMLLQHNKNQQAMAYYEQSALPQANTLMANADLLFRSGDISYLEWIMLVNQAIELQSGYLNAVADWNNTILELQLLNNTL